jgi:hypothetical protein
MKNQALEGDCGKPLYYHNPNFSVNLYLHIGSFDEPKALPPCQDQRTNPPGARG